MTTKTMPREFAIIYTATYISDHPHGMVWEVYRGHSAYESDRPNYRGLAQMTPPARFKSEQEANGFVAYNRDCDLRPTYHDGTKRPHWYALRDWARDTWVRNPTIPEDMLA